jgi:hypothetical protein
MKQKVRLLKYIRSAYMNKSKYTDYFESFANVRKSIVINYGEQGEKINIRKRNSDMPGVKTESSDSESFLHVGKLNKTHNTFKCINLRNYFL